MFARLRSFLTTLIQRERFEDSLDEEMRFHLDAQTEDLVRTGVPRAEAARRARVQFGSIEAVKNDCRRVRGLWITGEVEAESNIHLGFAVLAGWLARLRGAASNPRRSPEMSSKCRRGRYTRRTTGSSTRGSSSR